MGIGYAGSAGAYRQEKFILHNGKKDRLDRIEELLKANAEQITANTKALAHTRELLDMAAAQTSENAKLIRQNAKDLVASRKEHDREMKEIRLELKKLIQRIAI
jgi:site-specific recombinase